MDSNAARRQSEVMQNMLEALIKYDVIQEDEITSSADSIVTMEILWKLFQRSESKLEESRANQNKELMEVQKYVEHVRSLSEERDRLTEEFERENEKLKKELKLVQDKAESEAVEIADMCRQESLEELIGNSFSEQMAYLLVVRATLLDKLDAMQEQMEQTRQQHDRLNNQVQNLTSEDSELRQRMESAMSEMGGMASKLTEALKERDLLRKEVKELTQALDGIKTLPSVAQAKAESATLQKDLEFQRVFCTAETDRLREELQETKDMEEMKEADLTMQIEELQEVNSKLKDLNKKLNEEVSTLTDRQINNDRKKVYAESQKIIEQMQSALEEDEQKSQVQQEEYEEEISQLKGRVLELEMLTNKQGKQASADDQQIVSQLNAQLREERLHHDSQQREAEKLWNELTSFQRELDLREAECKSLKQQFETQVQITTDLQERNAGLETELTKAWVEVKEALDKLNTSERERGMLELKLKDHEEEDHEKRSGEVEDGNKVKVLREKVLQLENLLLSETHSTTSDNSVVVLQTKIQFYEAQIEVDRQARLELEEKLSSSHSQLDMLTGADDELRKTMSELQKRALNAEAHVLLISGEKNEQETQKLVAELNRTQLEDAVELMRRRMDVYASQVKSYVDRYKNLKQKHKTKIRRIRELFLSERKVTTEEIERLERRLTSAEDALERELAWKEEAADTVRSAERDRRNAINQADMAVQKVERSSEKINNLTHKKEDLESENGMLQKQLTLLEKQKLELERLVSSMQRKQQKEELNTLLSSLNMSGSLPYLGNTLGFPLNQFSSDSLNNNMEMNGKRDLEVTEHAHDDSWNSGGHQSLVPRLTSSYLNLSQSDSSSPAK